MLNKYFKILYLDFSRLLPDDSFFYNSFYRKCSDYGYDTVLIHWGSSFPWSVDERLGLYEHISDKTLSSFNNKTEQNDIRFIPVLPLFGGMEILLSFPSYCYLRYDNTASVLNPESAGSKSITSGFIDDYLSLMESTDTIALNCLMISKISESKILKSAASLINSVIDDDDRIKSLILYGMKIDEDTIASLSGMINLENINVVLNNDQENQSVMPDSPGIEFYIPDKYKNDYFEYVQNIQKAWDLTRLLKIEILRSIYTGIPPLKNDIRIDLCYNQLVDLFPKIRKTSYEIKSKLDDILNKKVLNIYIDCEIKIIENEIKHIEIDIGNLSVDFL